jgi:uncharacterized protein with HEPN domain
MRHVLVHDYFGVDRDVVWTSVVNEMGPLKASLTILLERVFEGALVLKSQFVTSS